MLCCLRQEVALSFLGVQIWHWGCERVRRLLALKPMLCVIGCLTVVLTEEWKIQEQMGALLTGQGSLGLEEAAFNANPHGELVTLGEE